MPGGGDFASRLVDGVEVECGWMPFEVVAVVGEEDNLVAGADVFEDIQDLLTAVFVASHKWIIKD